MYILSDANPAMKNWPIYNDSYVRYQVTSQWKTDDANPPGRINIYIYSVSTKAINDRSLFYI